MELRELIKSTVAELDDIISQEKSEIEVSRVNSSEKEFLEFIKERTEVLFLGLKTKEIVNIEDKLEIILKYLEFLLTKVDERLQKLK